MMSIWRRASYSIAWPMKRIELTFLISQRVPSGSPGPAHRDVDVGAQAALLHVAVAGAEIAQDGAQLVEKALASSAERISGLETISISATPERLRSTKRHRRVLVVQRLAGVLLEMQPLDADGRRFAVRQIDDDLALADDRLLVLADLIALRQIGIEIVLPVEHRAQIDLRLEAEPGAHRLRDAFSLITGSMPGIAASTSDT